MFVFARILISNSSHSQAGAPQEDNKEKIKQNKVSPYLVGNVVEVRSLYHFMDI